jgi:hypothetical protein
MSFRFTGAVVVGNEIEISGQLGGMPTKMIMSASDALRMSGALEAAVHECQLQDGAGQARRDESRSSSVSPSSVSPL